MRAYREIDPKRDLFSLGERLYRVSREVNKAELCRCEDRYNHNATCIWWKARKFLSEVQKEIQRMDLED